MKLYLASNNSHKVSEMNSLAMDTGGQITVLSAKDAGGMPHVVEDTGTFIGNARKKALALKKILPRKTWVLADDSGLCVDALGGCPGVESAYYAGPQGDSAANLQKLIQDLHEVPEGKRAAYFYCILYLIAPNGDERYFEGFSHGHLLKQAAGNTGFGYDPIFVPDGYTKTFAQLGDDVKNNLSHRAQAWRKLADWVSEQNLHTTKSTFSPKNPFLGALFIGGLIGIYYAIGGSKYAPRQALPFGEGVAVVILFILGVFVILYILRLCGLRLDPWLKPEVDKKEKIEKPNKK